MAALDANSQIVRGSATRFLRSVGGVAAVAAGLLALCLGLFARTSIEKKIAGVIAFIVVACALVICGSIAAAATVARVEDGTLQFCFCGLKTRSIPLDASAAFEMRTIGRLRVLVISRGRLTYVPNGALDTEELVRLLRASGVAERKSA